MNKYIEKIQVLATKLGNFSYINAITNGITSALPAIIIGSIYTLLCNIQFQPYLDFINKTRLINYLSVPNGTTMGIVAFLMAFTIAYHFANNHKQDGLSAGIISMSSFLILIPFELTESGGKAIPTSWLGATGMFTAMIVGLIAGKLFVFLKEKNIGIKMPDSVPPATVKAFSAIIPGFIITGVFLVMRAIFSITSFETFPQAISSIIQTPLLGIGDSVWAIALIYFLSNLVWFFGIHGIVIISVVQPILMALDLENLDRVTAGGEAIHIIGKNFTNIYGGMTGAGITIGLVILMIFRAKSQQYKTLGKLSIVPGIFCINEPVIFGTPIVLNPFLIIPFILVPTISIFVAYFLTQLGILPILSGLQLPWSMPPIISGFMLGGWRVALYQAVLIVVSVIIYYPFFRALDKKTFEDELRVEAENL